MMRTNCIFMLLSHHDERRCKDVTARTSFFWSGRQAAPRATRRIAPTAPATQNKKNRTRTGERSEASVRVVEPRNGLSVFRPVTDVGQCALSLDLKPADSAALVTDLSLRQRSRQQLYR